LCAAGLVRLLMSMVSSSPALLWLAWLQVARLAWLWVAWLVFSGDGVPLCRRRRGCHRGSIAWHDQGMGCSQFTRIGHVLGGGGHFCGRVALLATRQGFLFFFKPNSGAAPSAGAG